MDSDNTEVWANHTLVIPTYNRADHLRKLVLYYRNKAPSMRLLVVDSSRPEIARQNGVALAHFGGAVSHRVYPQDMMFVRKLNEGLAFVQTPYVSFCADDDVVFPTGIRSSVSFLHRHPSYASAHGIYLNFQTRGQDIHINAEYTGASIEAENPGARLFKLCQRYESLFYAVFRTPEARTIYSSLVTISTTLYQELFQSASTLIRGKVKRLPIVYAARQSGPPAQADLDKWQTFYWFADSPTEVLENYTSYRSLLWKFYHTGTPNLALNQHDFLKVVDLAHAIYFSAGCSPEYFYSQLWNLWPNDQYSRIGRLDTLPEARRLLHLKRHLWPSHRQAIDTLDHVRLGAAWNTWSQTGILGGLRFLGQSAKGYFTLLQMNTPSGASGHRSWRCCLPKHLVWMAGNRLFQDAYKELCFYLD